MGARRIVFIAGVHGVGKGYLCGRLAPMINGEHLTASNLIKNRKVLGEKKAISGIDENQSILVDELAAFKTEKPYILLDGHFCLYNEKHEIELLPEILFEKLNVAYIVTLICPPSTIMERLVNRDKNISNLSLNHIYKLQKFEIEQSHKISNFLKIQNELINVYGDITVYISKLSINIKKNMQL